ncbi:DIP1984 family protein [Mycolicibacterium porcinum]|uniref:DIP1984 family protein n=1 Tax=Mycolicibacterium porcinum TaxID=39693 RepID=UPI0008490568|nr:hypothetical protein [Mycolicibacterium porcinum]ODR25800.1 hypothetical protein BHQ19_10235 [Mycolicibacterium porcinum]
MKIAEALVLRKHLEAKVKQLEPVKLQGDNGLFEFRSERRNVNESVDEVTMQVPKIKFSEVTAEYDKYSKALRQLDTKIQEANWKFDVEFDDKDLAI